MPTSINGKTIPTTFVVIDGPGDILLGKTSSELFGAIHFDTTLHTNSVTNEDQAFRLSLQQHFPAVFEGVGKLRGHQATIHIDPTVTPVAQRPRRVPFALRPKVRDHLKDLMEKDIIEKVDGPSPWVSPVVVTPKPNGDIRLCVDMRQANEAIIRERHPIPTIDEVLEQLNGSTVFSKIDLRWGFHQVEFSEDSRSITTFALDENLYRYKRMMFGITSARIERWVLRLQPYDFKVRYTPGTTNIADALSRMPVDSADDEFRQFLSEMGIQHRRNTPFWPRANGEVERQNRTLLKTLKIAHAEQKNWNIELQRFLLAYRTTPHTTTGESPSKLLFGRDIRSKLPDLALFNENPNQPSAVRDNDSARKQAAKDRSDSRFNAKERDLEPGDKVLVRNDQPTNKLSTPFLPTPCKILDRHGDQLVIEKADHSIIRRNLHHAKRFLEEGKEEKTDEDEAKDQDAAETADEATAEDAAQTADEVKDQDAAETVETPVTPTPSTCRPKRNTAPPARFKDFVTSFR